MTQRDPRNAGGGDIDAHLKRAFQQITEEQLPDRFTDLLEKLRSGDGAGNGTSQASAAKPGMEAADEKAGRE